MDPGGRSARDHASGRAQKAHASARRLLAADPRPTAIGALSDQLALGVLGAADELGIRVPQELSVVGFDDAPPAALRSPGLTSVRQPLLEKGLAAGRLLLEGTAAGRRIELPVELVVRGSTAPPPD